MGSYEFIGATGRCHLRLGRRRLKGSARAAVPETEISLARIIRRRLRFFIVGISRRDYARANPNDLSRGCILRRIAIEDGSYGIAARR